MRRGEWLLSDGQVKGTAAACCVRVFELNLADNKNFSMKTCKYSQELSSKPKKKVYN